MKRVEFCGSIIGSVVVRSGETPDDAIRRAEATILNLLERSARNLGIPGCKDGPNICLETVYDYEEEAT